jgi:predicted anti-sigma-YlaC factor YlaD
MSEPEENQSNCHKFKDQLDSLIDAMVEARLQQEAGQTAIILEYSFEPEGALKEHLADCADCHNYQLANRVIIEAARALPRLKGDEALTQSILAMVLESQESESLAIAKSEPKITAPVATQSIFTLRSTCLLVASFIAFTVTTSGFTTDGVWSACSWAVALIAVAMLKPLIEGKLSLTNTNSLAKA